jgi:deoxyribodipyrimidine photo-lyase
VTRVAAAKHRTLAWFRNDLRVRDNPALNWARERGSVIAVYFAAPAQWSLHGMSANRRAFLLRTLAELSRSLARLNIPLLIRTVAWFDEQPAAIVNLARSHVADAVTCNDEYPLDEQRRDAATFDRCRAVGIELRRFGGGVVLAPGQVLTGEGKPYTVFTPFRRRWLSIADDGLLQPLDAPKRQTKIDVERDPIPKRIGGVAAGRLADLWPGGEAEAARRLDAFVARALRRYHEDRDRPDRDGTSRLSPYLAVGAISARQCIAAARQRERGTLDGSDIGASTWISELIWREFYAHVAAAFPDISRGRAFRPANERVRWRDAPAEFVAWRDGRTGYPLVDAAMRQLAASGWMHNRLRMLTAMFLTKHLLIDWRLGERHFMDLLVDGDFAANNGGWQWSASTGTDAAPYFRVFNPVAQARKFDPDGAFVRRWVPELACIRGAAIFEPWRSGGAPGYPAPIVDHAVARQRALKAFTTRGRTVRHANC